MQIEKVVVWIEAITSSVVWKIHQINEGRYRESNFVHTLFIKRKSGKITALILYVDDMVVIGVDPKGMEALQRYLSSEFEMKDLGQLKYFLGIEVARSKEGNSLSQKKYVLIF